MDYFKAVRNLADAMVDDVKNYHYEMWNDEPNDNYDSFEDFWENEADEIMEQHLFEIADDLIAHLREEMEF